MSRPATAYKIIDRPDWRLTLAEGRYEGSAVDRADGFIHLSTDAQLAGTAAKHFAGRDDLMLLTVDLTAVEDLLAWEPSRGGDLFPHLYGALPRSAVVEARGLRVDAAGAMTLEGATT